MVALPLADDRRVRDRLEVDRHAVLRLDNRAEPILIEDLTAGGCRFRCDADLPLYEDVSVGIAGVGPTQAQIVWRRGEHYGCAFAKPLPISAVTAQAPANVARIASTAPRWQIDAELDFAEPEVAKLPLRTRVAVITGMSAGLWSVIIGGGWLLVS